MLKKVVNYRDVICSIMGMQLDLPTNYKIHKAKQYHSPANVCMKSFTCIVKTVSLGELSVLPKDTVLYSA